MTAHPLAKCLLSLIMIIDLPSFFDLVVIVSVVPLLVALQESEPASPFGRGPLIVLVLVLDGLVVILGIARSPPPCRHRRRDRVCPRLRCATLQGRFLAVKIQGHVGPVGQDVIVTSALL